MRVLHLSHGYPPAVGGSENVMRELSERLVERGHDVTVVTTTAFNTSAFREPYRRLMRAGSEERGGVHVRRHHADSRLAPRLGRVHGLAHRLHVPFNGVLRTLYDGPLAPGMLEDACRLPADVIGATAFPLAHMHMAVLAGRTRRVPVALWGALHPNDRWGYDRGVIRSSIRHADAYVAYTAYEADVVASYGVPEERIHVIAPGVDAAERGDRALGRRSAGIPDDVPVVGFLGQFGGHKGVDTLVHAMRHAWYAAPDAWLLLAGASTPFLPHIRAAIAKLPPSRRRRVRMLLDVAPARKPDLLAAMDVFASPSGFESFGLTFVEAWLAGLPVVGCKGGAVESVVRHGETGLLVQYGSMHELGGALIELLLDPDLRARLAAAGQREAQTIYTWDNTVDATERLYGELAAVRAGAA